MKTTYLFLSLLMIVAGFECCNTPVKNSDCMKPAEPGVCMAAIPRYYYNPQTGNCEQFTWGGCGDFPFTTMEECESTCE